MLLIAPNRIVVEVQLAWVYFRGAGLGFSHTAVAALALASGMLAASTTALLV